MLRDNDRLKKILHVYIYIHTLSITSLCKNRWYKKIQRLVFVVHNYPIMAFSDINVYTDL
jgi:hypothetical protein